MASRRRRTRRLGPADGGFTLIELLVVIMIIGVLLGMAWPTIGKIRIRVVENKSRAIVNLIGGACMQYQAELGDYPHDLAHLVRELTGHLPKGDWNEQDSKFDGGDGRDGWGLRLVPRGRVYGPYGGTERLREKRNDVEVFIDAFDESVMYTRLTGEGWQELADYGGPADIDVYLKDTEEEYLREDFALITRGVNGKWDRLCIGGKWTQSDDITNLTNE